MRIIGGRFKAQALQYPKNRLFRPTQDRVKESIFNIIQPKIAGASVLDLFCGTGGLGLEALSRGAQRVVCVDTMVAYCLKNVAAVQSKVSDKLDITVVKRPASRYLASCSTQFDLILMDPPWEDVAAYADSLKGIVEFDILGPDGLIVCEHSTAFSLVSLDLASLSLCVSSDYRYGRSVVSLLRHVRH